jgi:hypothetical protein
MIFDSFFSILNEGLKAFVADSRSTDSQSYDIPIKSFVGILVKDCVAQDLVVKLLYHQSTSVLMNVIFGFSTEARRRYGKAACITILIDCAKLGGPLNRKPYRNLHLGTTGDKNEFRRRFDSLQLDVPTILFKRTHSTSSITNSSNSDDNMVGVEHSTESATSTGNVFCIKTVLALLKRYYIVCT